MPLDPNPDAPPVAGAEHRSPFDRSDSVAAAHFEAHRIAFAPVVFQVVQVLRREGVLRHLVAARGYLTTDDLQRKTGLSRYALTILLETAFSAGVVDREQTGEASAADVRWKATGVGRLIERDESVRVNMDFVAHVCYRALEHLGQAVKEGRPAGLRELGDWATFYEGMASMPEPARSSWFNFDHFYSDSAFPAAIKILAASKVRHIADVGANTGRFAAAFLEKVPGSHVTLCDLPQQLELARENLAQRDLLRRTSLYPCDLLDEDARLPDGQRAPDAFWMSQFLCCFAEPQIVSILGRAARALRPGGAVYVLDTFWDDQRYDAAAYCLINTSPYFAAVANGNSRMYRADVILNLAQEAGLEPTGTWSDLGWSHTMIRFEPAVASPPDCTDGLSRSSRT